MSIVGSPPHMRQSVTVILLATLFIFASTMTLLESSSEELTSLDSNSAIVISSNTEWNGTFTISDDVIINNGVTLVVKPSTEIEITADLTITVLGNMVIADDALFYSSMPASNSGSRAGLWTGIEIMLGGSATLNGTEIQNARTAVSVSGVMESDSLAIYSSYSGMDVDGDATVTSMVCMDIDIVCASVTGMGDIGAIQVTNASTAIYQSGDLSVGQATFTDVGTGFDIHGGSGNHSLISLDNVWTGWRVRSITSVSAENVNCTSVGLLVDAGDSDGFELSNVDGNVNRVVRAEGLQGLSLSNATLSTVAVDTTAIDVRNDGDLMIEDSTFQGYTQGLDLRGSGTHTIIYSDFSVMGLGVRGSGSGHLYFYYSNLTSAGDISDFSQIDTTIEFATLTGGNAATNGISWVGGFHYLTSVNISRPYVGASDTMSIGIGSWWSTVVGSDIAISGWHEGIECESCTMSLEEVSIIDGGTDGGTSISANNANLYLGDLETRHSTTAIELLGDSTFVSSSWDGDQHNNALFVGDDSTAAIRDFSTGIVQGVDAVGGGELHWGSTDSTPPSITVSITKEYTETSISITDLAGTDLENAIVQTGPWTEFSDSDGNVTLPLFASGSEVTATLSGAGAYKLLTGGLASQVLQIPIIPSGDWVIPNGLNVVLGETADGSAHQLSGNLTIESGGSLFISSSTVSLPSSNSVEVQSGGLLSGDGGVLDGGLGLSAIGSNSLHGLGEGIELKLPTVIDCGGTSSFAKVSTSYDLTLGAGCDLSISEGSITGQVILGTSAFLQVSNKLSVLVLDAGTPVENVNLNVGGVTFITNSSGQASMSYTARSDDSTGTTWYGAKYVVMQRNGHQQYFNWDLNNSMEHTFISSTLASGSLSDWMILDSEWSPWYLEDDLIIPAGQTLNILDNTELVIDSGVEISVLGTLTLGEATIHSIGGGARWAGLVLSGNEALLETSGGHIVEATLPISASGSSELFLSGTEIARGIDGLVTLSSGSSGGVIANLNNVNLHDSSTSCIYSQGEGVYLQITDMVAANCGDYGVWLRQSNAEINGLILGAGNNQGMELADVNGNITNVDSTEHDGASASIFASEINGDLILQNLNLGVGVSSPALEVVNSRNFNLNGLQVSGSPAVDFDTIAGAVSNMQLSGSGSGTGVIAHHARGSGELVISDSVVSNYSVALSLHGSAAESMNPRFVSANNQWTAITAISSDGRSFESVNDEINGAITADSSTELRSDIYNAIIGPISSPSSNDSQGITVVGDASVVFWWDVSFAATLDGLETQASVEVVLDLPMDEVEYSSSGLQQEMTIPFHLVDSSASQRATITISASATGGLPYLDSFIIDERLESQYILAIDINTLPSIQIIDPDDGLTLMQGTPLILNATATDVESMFGELQVSWSITDMMGERVWSSVNWDNSQNGLAVGTYVIKVEVTDSHGGVSTMDVEIEVIPLDSDGDWTPDCNTDWYDPINGVQCGPDEYDSDDDNDGISDERDAWPTDPCASEDSDMDGMPNTLHCPENVNSDLVEDYDDDNDGVLDVDENKSAEESGFSMSTVVAIFLLIGLGYFLLNRNKLQA